MTTPMNGHPVAEAAARATLDDLANRRRTVTAAITTLSAFYGLDPAAWLDEAPTNGARPPSTHDEEPRTKKRGRKAKHSARPTQAPTGFQEQILEALKAAGEPVSPGELADKMKVNVHNLRYHLKTLIASNLVNATGSTSDRRVSMR